MSKAALIIDMPERCEECPLAFGVEGQEGANICRGCQKYSFNPDTTQMPDWCPLVPVPEKVLKPFSPPGLEEKALGTVGEYAARLAESHGISITEAMKHPEVKAYAQAVRQG